MVRIDDEERVFDVSRPHKTSPPATSKPIIVGHRPMMGDPMMKDKDEDEKEENNLYSTHPDKKITPVHVTIEDSEPETSAAPTPVELKHPQEENAHESLFENQAAAKEETTAPEALVGTPPDPQYVPPDSLMDEKDEPLPEQPTVSDSPEPPITVLPLSHSKGAGPQGPAKKIMTWLAVLLILGGVGAYLAIDAGIINSNIKLPFEIFKEEKAAPIVTTPAVSTTPKQTTVPEGFTNYKLAGTAISFAYPTIWGEPTATPEPGYSSRTNSQVPAGNMSKSDGTYAYLVNFPQNKDVQIALTSAKYLPGTRAAAYYDFLQWCVGTNDSKFYKQILKFTTAGGTDTPTTVACDQGPLLDATKLDERTISQLKTKGADNKDLGDVYTKNITEVELPVLRVKDAAMTNGENIKKLLTSVQAKIVN